jgi:hypothetical protein
MIIRPLLFVACSGVAFAQTVGPNFTNHFTFVSLSAPTTPLSWGGVNFKPGAPDVLLMGGHAYNAAGEIWEVPITRDANGHINGLAGGDALVAAAPYIDGGLTIAPGNVLLYTSWPGNEMGQIKPGSTAPDRLDLLTTYGVSSSTGGACIVPAGFAGAGRLKLTSYTADGWYDMALTPDGNGTFAPGIAGPMISLPGTGYGGPEGIAYVHGGAAGFAVDSVVIAEYGEWQIAVYDIDANGDPIPATRQVLLDTFTLAEGVVLDPSTGDFVVVRQGGGLGVLQRAAQPPTAYCTAGTTTNGCSPSMSSSGTPSASATSGFTLSASNVEGQKQGILFYGISGRVALVWGTGTSFLCVKSPTQRMGNQNSGGVAGACNGLLSQDWLAYVASNPGALGAPFQAGNVVNVQAWFRDPPASKTTNLSNGYEFTVTP